jgi:hypothetical protein
MLMVMDLCSVLRTFDINLAHAKRMVSANGGKHFPMCRMLNPGAL